MFNKKSNGQTLVIMAFGLIVLIAFAALAIDAGNAYNARREAQNAADAAALAATRQLLIECSGAGAGVVGNVTSKVNEMVGANDVSTANVQAYYVLENGTRWGNGQTQVGAAGLQCGCGAGDPRGVEVVVTNQKGSFLAGFMGQSVLGATASAKGRYAPAASVASGVYPITRRYDPANWPAPGTIMAIRVTDQTPADTGNFGWLVWGSAAGGNDLSAALTGAGTFSTAYCDLISIPPRQLDCNRAGGRTLSIGEWVEGRTGNVASMEDELIALMNANTTLIIPLYDSVEGQGGNFKYHVAAFASFKLVPFAGTGSPLDKSGNEKSINARFVGMAAVGDMTSGCQLNAVNVVKLVP